MLVDKKLIESNKKIDKIFRRLFLTMAIISGSFIVIIVIFVFEKGISPFLPGYEFGTQSIWNFLTGMIYRQDQAIYGVGFIVINTLLCCLLALILSFPMSVLTALFIVKIAPKHLSSFMQTIVELLASVPSIVYGLFAAGVINSLVKNWASYLGFSTFGGSSFLSVIILLAIMIFPVFTSMSISAIKAVDYDLEQASLALGATPTQTNFKVVLTAAKSGIFAGAILGLGRAFGEATAVSMVAGNKLFGPTVDPFDITRTLTSTMLAGLKETTGLDYDIRFSVGVVLMLVIFLSNFILNLLKKRIGNQI